MRCMHCAFALGCLVGWLSTLAVIAVNQAMSYQRKVRALELRGQECRETEEDF